MIDGKMYVGITSIEPEKRWNRGFGYQHNPHFWSAIKKYGWNNFDHVVLVSGLTRDEASEIEKNLISDLMTQDPKYGYNIANGGYESNVSEETKRKMSAAALGNYNRNCGTPKKKVLCVETGEIFDSCSSAARWCGSNSSHISNACRGNFEKTKGYHWKYA